MNSLQLFLYLFFFASLIVSSTQNDDFNGTCTSKGNDKKLYEFMLEFKKGENDKLNGSCGDGFDVTVTKDGSGEKGVNFTYTEVENYKNKCNSTSEGDKFICYIYFSNDQSLDGTIFKGNVLTLNGKSKDEKCELTNRRVKVDKIEEGNPKNDVSICGNDTINIKPIIENSKCRDMKIAFFELNKGDLATLNELNFELPVVLQNGETKNATANCTKKVDDKTECTIDTEKFEEYWKEEGRTIVYEGKELNITNYPGFKVKIVDGGSLAAGKCGIQYDKYEFIGNGIDDEEWECPDNKEILSFKLKELKGEKFTKEIKLKDNLTINNPTQHANCSTADGDIYLNCIIFKPKMKKGEKIVIPDQILKADGILSDEPVYKSMKIIYRRSEQVLRNSCIKEERQGSYSVPTKKSGLSGGAIAGICVGAGVLLLGALAAALLCSKGASIPAIPQAIPPSAPLVNTPMAQMPKFHDAPLPPKVDIAPTYSSVHPLPKPQVSQLVYQVPGYSMPVYQGPPIYEEPIVNIQGSNLVPDPHFQVSMAQVGEVPIVNPTHNSQFAYI